MTDTYYRISPAFWHDPCVEAWADDSRMLALYLLTCPQRTTEGLFKFRKAYALSDLGWNADKFDAAFEALVIDDFIDWDEETQTLLIVSALKWQSPQNGNQVIHAVKKLSNLQESRLTRRFKGLCERFAERLHKGLPEGFGEPLPEPNDEPLEEGLPKGIPDPHSPSHAPAQSPPPPLGEVSKPTRTNRAREALVTRVNSVCVYPSEEAERVVDHLLQFVDYGLVDECVGFVDSRIHDEDAPAERPRHPRYFHKAVRDWAKDRGIDVPGLVFGKVTA